MSREPIFPVLKESRGRLSTEIEVGRVLGLPAQQPRLTSSYITPVPSYSKAVNSVLWVLSVSSMKPSLLFQLRLRY